MATIAVPAATRRYRFSEWLNVYPERERKRLMQQIRKTLGLDFRTLPNWLDLPIDARSDVPYSAVKAICELLGKDVADALNEQLPMLTRAA